LSNQNLFLFVFFKNKRGAEVVPLFPAPLLILIIHSEHYPLFTAIAAFIGYIVWYADLMGRVEANAKRKRGRRNVRNAALAIIGAAGMIAVAAVAPNIMQLLGRSGALARLRYQTKSTLARLKQKGEIEFVEREGMHFARLTKRGEEALAFGKEKMELEVRKPRRWDRRYRLVMFDVPEKRKKIRERLRFTMKEVGFLRLQDSAWLYPYDCEEFVALLKAHLRIGKDVLYAVIEEIENDKWIRKHFNLPAD
jgi:CRISPR/Cas system-associated endoribonuclease Cas2